MFSKYTDLSGTRNFMEAVGFFIFFSVFLVGLSTMVVHVLGAIGVIESVTTFFVGGHVHVMIGSAFVLLLASLVVNQKGMSKDILSILLVILALGLSYQVDILLGMVPVAILTMLKKA